MAAHRHPRRFTKIPLNGAAPEMTRFAKPAKRGTSATLRRDLRAIAKSVEPPSVEPQAFPVVAAPLTSRAVRSIVTVATSDEPERTLIQHERRDLEQHVGDIYSALVTLQYQETREGRDEALRAARKLTGAKRREALEAIEYGFDAAVSECINAFSLAGADVSADDLETMGRRLRADRAAYKVIADIRARAVSSPTTTPRDLIVEIVPTTTSELLGKKAILDLEIPGPWCGFDPVEGSVTKHFSRSFDLRSTLSYPCGIKWCTKWKVPYPCGTKWCSGTITWASGSIALSFEVGYKINCCGGTAWGSGEAEACGTVLNQTLCATCSASVTGVIGAGQIGGAGNDCTYGLGLTANISCELGGYTVFSGNFSFGWVIDGPCPPTNLCEAAPTHVGVGARALARR